MTTVHDEIVAVLRGGPASTPDIARKVARATRTDVNEVIASMWDLEQDGITTYAADDTFRLTDRPATATAGTQTEDTMPAPEPRDQIALLREMVLVADKLAHDLHSALTAERRQPERLGSALTVRQVEDLTIRVRALGSFANQVAAERRAHR